VEAVLNFSKHEVISLKNHAEYNEKWLQNRIAEDPAILGLGDLELRDMERSQPHAGRLDILLQDEEDVRYEVEIQLGQSDESHIIRTIEYWDIERKRYPQYDHIAVIVAEEITGRFLNVIGLFNGFIPLIALQLKAVKIGDQLALVATKVLDVVTLGPDGTDGPPPVPTDRNYWLKKASKETVELADRLFEIVRGIDPSLELKYNKFYLGLSQNDRPNNFVSFTPQKSALRIRVRLGRSDEIDRMLDESGLEVLEYDKKWGIYQIRLTTADLPRHDGLFKQIFSSAYSG
jgi:predicted transport protein